MSDYKLETATLTVKREELECYSHPGHQSSSEKKRELFQIPPGFLYPPHFAGFTILRIIPVVGTALLLLA